MAILRTVVAALTVLGSSVSLGAEDPAPTETPGWVILDERPGDGEQCLVCGKRIFDEDVVEIRYQGRTFHVGAPFLSDFKNDPDQYFVKLQARSALFDEAAMQTPPMAYGWLWLGVYVVAGLIFGAACAYVAVSRALAPIPWFFAGLLGNVIALVAVFVCPRGEASVCGIPRGLRKVPTTRAPSPCPSCSATNHPAARRCSVCGSDLQPSVEPETARVPSGGQP